MKTAELKGIRVVGHELVPAEVYHPGSGCFSVWLELMVGIRGEDGSDSFQVLVCDAQWIERHSKGDAPAAAKMVVVDSYDFAQLKNLLAKKVEAVHGETWIEIAQEIRSFAEWEFEDYKE